MIKIQKAEVKDAKLLTRLARLSFEESHGASAPAEDIQNYITQYFTESSFEKELQNQQNVYYLIYFNDKPAGFSKIVFNCPHANIPEPQITKLDRIYLLKEFYGQKLGQTLFEFNFGLSRQKGQRGLWLYVWKGNERAVRFYQKVGFKIVGSHDFKISETHYNPNHQMFLSLGTD